MKDPQLKDMMIRMIKAQQEVGMRRAMYPGPYDLILTPVHVVRAFRGVSEPTVFVQNRINPDATQAGEEYLFQGGRTKQMLPPFPEMSDLAINDYIEVRHVAPIATVQRHLQFLAATTGVATVMGTLVRHHFGGGGREPISGVRVLVSSGTQVVETTTRDDGGFVASGLRPGEIEIRPVLDADLTVVNETSQTVTIPTGACANVNLYVGVNGRVRGRILGPSSALLRTMTLTLYTAREDRRIPRSDGVRVQARAREDGSFEFIGVPPGSYSLSASFERMDLDKWRTITTYYPGTDDIDAAIPIVVGKATQHDGFDFIVRTE